MKRNIRLLLLAILVAPLLILGTATADEDPNHTEANNETTQTPETKPRTGNEGLSLQQRLDKYKTEAKTRLNNAEKLRLTARCKAAQTPIHALTERLKNVETRRGESYKHLVDHLNELSTKLKAKNIDTTTLDAQIKELQTKIDTFYTDLAKYKEAAEDLATMDCAADPTAFKAALESARTLRAKTVEDGKAIRTYLSETIKPTLQAIRKQLADTEGEE